MDVKRNIRSPLLARWLLRGLVPCAQSEFALGDLEEQFQQLVDSHVGRRGARAWYWRQVWKCCNERTVSPQTGYAPPRRKGAGMMETFWQDVRYALRSLRQKPMFAAVVVLTLALGIGANTAIFTLADAVIFRTLPVEEPERLANLMVQHESGLDSSFNYPLFTDYRDKNDVFYGLTGYSLTALHLSTSEESARIRGMLVSWNYFDVLGVRPALGRSFLAEEDRVGSPAQVAVISHHLWQNRFAGRGDILNQEILLNGHRFTIVGVAPRGFVGNFRGLDAQIYFPVANYTIANPGRADALPRRTHTWMEIVGRLKPGVTREQAQERMRALAAQIRETEPMNTYINLVLADGSRGLTSFVDDLEKPLTLLQLIVALVLLIACANVANLLIARAVARRKEMAVRLALGAGRWRLVRQLLTESTLLAVMGGAAGLMVAVWLAGFLRSFRQTLDVDTSLDPRVLLFTLGVTLATGLLFGLAPAWQAVRTSVVATLKEDPRTGRGRRWNLRSALVVTQIGLSLVVLASAGLAVKSLRALNGIDSGLDTERVMLYSLDVGRSGYDESRGRQFFDALLERVRALPGVEAAGLAVMRPLSGSGMRWTSVPEGVVHDDKNPINLSLNRITPGYFAAMGVPVVRGRDFTAKDAPGSARVGIVNEVLVRTYWPGDDGIGKRVLLGTNPADPESIHLEIVGVVRDSKYRLLTEPSIPTVYIPHVQNYSAGVTLAVRSQRPMATVEPVRAAVRSLDATLPIFGVISLAEQLDVSLATPRMAASLLSLFGGLALLLGVVGLYGVMAWVVAQRTHEIGIRMALGADRGDIFRLVLSHGLKMVAVGTALGLAGAFAATRMMESLLYEVQPRDPATLAAVGVVLAVAALAACYFPARRATRTDPMRALRYE